MGCKNQGNSYLIIVAYKICSQPHYGSKISIFYRRRIRFLCSFRMKVHLKFAELAQIPVRKCLKNCLAIILRKLTKL